ncbi:MAG: ABC transporter substrate-binding protein [Betaproteobacteria bacterium]|nr:ABC transporter substrate-binding protein [Betaproteobacteria bacterium]MBI2958998.1 ABC transporter substrate-binding protein [Betaproteobacteria bacterium]
MIKRRKLLLALGLSMLSAAVPCLAQQQAKVWRIGFLGQSSAAGSADRVEAFRAGLREFGYLEGKSLNIEFRWAEDRYEQLPALAAELARLKPDVIVTHGAAGVRAAKSATTAIPVVMANVGDPVATGLVASLAQPGGNVTGSTFFTLEIYGKQIELLKEIFPRARRFAFLMNPDNPSTAPTYSATEAAAKLLKVDLQQFATRGPGEFESAFSAMLKTRVDAVVVTNDSLFTAHATTIAELAAKRRLPVASGRDLAEAGCLLGYGHNVLDSFRRAGYFVDRILKGAKPADLPVERPTRFELVINAKAAKQIGVTIPPKVLARADRVIE